MKAQGISLAALVRYLDTLLDPTKLDENALNGIQVSHEGAITSVATAVSASLEAIEKAAALGVQALIVHHGIFKKNEIQAISGIQYRKIKMLMDHNIALLCYHLPLDAHQVVGNNWKAARDLGLQELTPFAEFSRVPIGVIGSLPSQRFDEFKQKVETYYGRPAAAVKVKDPVSRVAIVSGGAERFIKVAASLGADCFITGRVDEPVWDWAHEDGISFLGLGHYATETVGPKALANYLQDVFQIPCSFIHTANPF